MRARQCGMTIFADLSLSAQTAYAQLLDAALAEEA